MPRYYVNKNAQTNGDHEVHKSGCSYMPNTENRTYLGEFPSCKEAMVEARKIYKNADGCYYCSNECHKK